MKDPPPAESLALAIEDRLRNCFSRIRRLKGEERDAAILEAEILVGELADLAGSAEMRSPVPRVPFDWQGLILRVTVELLMTLG